MATAEQQHPLAQTLDRASSNEEAAGDQPVARWTRSRRRRSIAIAIGIVLSLFVVILTISLTVFKVKDPEIATNSVTLSRARLVLLGGAFNMTVTADVSVKNPNAASFDYDPSTTTLSYSGTTIGEAVSPAGSSPARRTVRMLVTVNVMADRLIANPNFLSKAVSGTTIPMSTLTVVTGRVKVLGPIRPRVRVRLSCDFDVSVMDQSTRNFVCRRSVRF